jgi:hypothetical protein
VDAQSDRLQTTACGATTQTAPLQRPRTSVLPTWAPQIAARTTKHDGTERVGRFMHALPCTYARFTRTASQRPRTRLLPQRRTTIGLLYTEPPRRDPGRPISNIDRVHQPPFPAAQNRKTLLRYAT